MNAASVASLALAPPAPKVTNENGQGGNGHESLVSVYVAAAAPYPEVKIVK